VGSKKSEQPSKKSAPSAKAAVPSKTKLKPASTAKAAKNGAPPAQAQGKNVDKDDDDDVDSSFPPPTKANGKAKEQLINLGKSKGFLTYDDVHEALPGEDVGPDQMDDVLSALDDEEIEVVDDASNIKIAPHRGADEEAPPKTAAKSEADDSPAEGPTPSSAPARAGDDEYYKSNDPVRMWLCSPARVRSRSPSASSKARTKYCRRSCRARWRCARSSTSASGSATTRSASRTSYEMPRTRSTSSTKRKRTAASSV
jgi:hypothetical protein